MIEILREAIHFNLLKEDPVEILEIQVFTYHEVCHVNGCLPLYILTGLKVFYRHFVHLLKNLVEINIWSGQF